MSREANINFVKWIKIQQNLFRSLQGAWLPAKTDFEVEESEFSEILPNILFMNTYKTPKLPYHRAKR